MLDFNDKDISLQSLAKYVLGAQGCNPTIKALEGKQT